MKILSRRFLASYLTFYLAILFASILVISIVEMMLNFDAFLEFSDGCVEVLSLLQCDEQLCFLLGLSVLSLDVDGISSDLMHGSIFMSD